MVVNTTLLETLQQFTAAICGVYFNEIEKTIFIVRPYTGDSENSLYKSLFFNDSVAQLRVYVEELSSENLFRKGANDYLSYNTLSKGFQPLDLESIEGDLNEFSKILNASKRIWGFEEYQNLLRSFIEEHFGDRCGLLWMNVFEKNALATGYDEEKKVWELYLLQRPGGIPDSWVYPKEDEEEMMKKVSRFIRILLQPIEETVE